MYGFVRVGGSWSELSISTPGGRARATEDTDDPPMLGLFERPSGEGGGECACEWDETEKAKGDGWRGIGITGGEEPSSGVDMAIFDAGGRYTADYSMGESIGIS